MRTVRTGHLHVALDGKGLLGLMGRGADYINLLTPVGNPLQVPTAAPRPAR